MLVLSVVPSSGLDLSKWQLTPHIKTKTLDEAIKQYFEGRTNLLHVRVQLDFSDSWQNKVIDNLAEVLSNSNELSYIINIQNRDDELANKFYYNNIWYVDSYRAVRAILPNFNKYQENYAGFYMIIMHLTYDHLDPMPIIQQTLKTMNDFQIINVNIAVHNNADEMVLYSYDAFRPDGCVDVKPIIKNYFINGRFVNDELFPKKLTNFHKCKLAVLSRNVAPFLYHNSQERQVPPSAMRGIEAEMIKVISTHLNFTPLMTIIPAESWGDVYDNGTITGPFALLSNRTVDVLMGYFTYEPHRILHFSETISYLIMPLVAVVNHKREIQSISPSWMIDPLMWSTWLCIVAFLTIGIMIAWTMQRQRQRPQKRSKGYPKWIDVIGIILAISCSINRPKQLGIRSWIMAWSIGFFICGAAYQGQLFVAYKHEYSTKPLTLDDLKAGNYTFIIRHTSNMDQLLKSDLQVTSDRIIRIHTNRANDIYKMLVKSTKNVGSIAMRLRVLHYMVNNGYYNDLHTPPEVLRLRQVCAYFRPRSYLLKPFNDVIGILANNGFISKWHQDAEYQLEKKFYRYQLLTLEPYPRPLHLSTFRPIFFVHIGLLAFALTVFGCELCFQKHRIVECHVPKRIRAKIAAQIKKLFKRHNKVDRKPYKTTSN